MYTISSFHKSWIYLNDTLIFGNVIWNLPHLSHVCGRGAECVRSWETNLDLSENDLPHTAHAYGRSPECTRSCIFRQPFSLNDWPHTPHTYGRDPECTRSWFSKLCLNLKDFPHVWQVWGGRNSSLSSSVSCSLSVWPSYKVALLLPDRGRRGQWEIE